MSHLTCDRVELSLPIWLENSFSVESQKWGSCSGPSGETIVCEYDMLYSKVHGYRHPWVTASGVGFSTGTISQISWNVWFIYPVYVQRTKEIWIFPPGVFGGKKECAEGYIFISEPPQCRLFRNQEKNNLFLVWQRCRSHVIQRDLKGLHMGEYSQPQEQ